MKYEMNLKLFLISQPRREWREKRAKWKNVSLSKAFARLFDINSLIAKVLGVKFYFSVNREISLNRRNISSLVCMIGWIFFSSLARLLLLPNRRTSLFLDCFSISIMTNDLLEHECMRLTTFFQVDEPIDGAPRSDSSSAAAARVP
jgi:hypothetical protein